MRKTAFLSTLLLYSCLTPASVVLAQDNQSAERTDTSEDQSSSSGGEPDDKEITVKGRKLRGTVESELDPARVLNPIDIGAYGAGSVEELVGSLANELDSNRGAGQAQPIVLLNGRRISSFEEIAAFPPEAIERAEIYPEQLAIELGFPANQKVINLVTFARFTQMGVRGNLMESTEGGGGEIVASSTLLKIMNNTRINASVDVQRGFQILESERGIIQPEGLDDQASIRSLLPSRQEFGGRAGLAGGITRDINYSISAGVRYLTIDALLGSIADRPVEQNIDSLAVNVGSVIGGTFDKWSWTHTARFDLTNAENTISTDDAVRADSRAEFKVRTVATDVTLVGPLIKLPAGNAAVTVRLGYNAETIESEAVGAITSDLFSTSRDTFEGFASINLPISTAKTKSQIPIGALALSGSARFLKVEERESLFDLAGNLTWSPAEFLTVLVSAETQSAVPNLLQLTTPPVLIPNSRVFDFSLGETVDITQLTGGNDGLQNETTRLFDVNATLRPAFDKNFRFSISYSNRRTENAVSAFPILTTDIQQALPERFSVDNAGILTTVDTTPFNIFRTRTRSLNFATNWTSSIGKTSLDSTIGVNPNPGGPLPPDLVPPGGKVIYAPPGTPLPPDLINALSRIFLSLNYTLRLDDTVQLTPGSEVLDLLDGFALNARGGAPRHQLRFSGGVFRRGLGMSVNLALRSNTFIRDDAIANATDTTILDLDFDPMLDFQVFLNPQDRIVGQVPKILQGMQVVLRIDNAFNARPNVIDQLGQTPLPFQSPILEPLGRSISISVRKIF